jgi:hypothetical protein
MQMPSFKRKPGLLQEATAEIARLSRQQARIEQKHAAARAEYESSMAARLQIFTQNESDEPAIEKKAQGRVDAARSAVEGLAVALEQIDRELADANSRRDAEQHRVDRRRAADDLESEIAAAEKALAPALAAMKNIETTFGALADVGFHFRAISDYIKVASAAVEGEAALAFNDMRSLIAAVLDGSSRIPGREKDQPLLPVPAPPPAVQRIWLTKRIIIKNGALEESHRSNRWIDLDPRLAAKAIADGVALALGSPGAGKIVESWGDVHGYAFPPTVHHLSLDEDARPQS